METPDFAHLDLSTISSQERNSLTGVLDKKRLWTNFELG